MLIPSIDIMDGRAVQLRQGRELLLESPADPLELAMEFQRYGTPAVVDLDAALGRGGNRDLVREICRKTEARVGGGIRDLETARDLLRAGASRLMIGTCLWEDFVMDLPRERVQAALDTRDGRLLSHGWTRESGTTVEEALDSVSERAGSVLFTFVEGEGGMEGIPFRRIEELRSKCALPMTVAGGVGSTEEAAGILRTGVDLQAGMALYAGRLDPASAVADAVPPNELLPTVVEDVNGQVLMLAWSSRASLTEALRTGRGVYYSRSRKRIWRKGETSSNVQSLLKCRFDCDADTVLFTVQQKGSACHLGSYSCFGKKRFDLSGLQRIVNSRRTADGGSLSRRLLEDPEFLSRKIMEEAGEVTESSGRDGTLWEVADLAYFLTVLLEMRGCTWREVEMELEGRSLL